MMKFRRSQPAPTASSDGSLLDRPDLRIGNLLDDPRLRKSMGLDEPVPVRARPEPRFDRRRLLDRAIA